MRKNNSMLFQHEIITTKNADEKPHPAQDEAYLIEKRKTLPFPGWLSTHIFPSCFSTNSLQSNKPRPVPFSFSVPRVDSKVSLLNSLPMASSVMPTPVSDTATTTWLSSQVALRCTLPFLGVNLMEFVMRFLRIALHMF